MGRSDGKPRAANKLSAAEVFEGFKRLTGEEAAEFINLCVSDEGRNAVKTLNTTATVRLEALLEMSEHNPFKWRRTMVARDGRIVELRATGLTHAQIGNHPDVIALNDKKPMERMAVLAAAKRYQERNG